MNIFFKYGRAMNGNNAVFHCLEIYSNTSDSLFDIDFHKFLRFITKSQINYAMPDELVKIV